MQAILVTTLFSLIAAIIGATVGAFIVHWLTRSREFESWSRDTRLKEWRELLDVMTNGYMTLLTIQWSRRTILKVQEEADAEKVHRALADVDVNLATRIFISQDLSELDVRNDWANCVTNYMSSHDKVVFKSTFQSIRTSLIDAAMKKPD